MSESRDDCEEKRDSSEDFILSPSSSGSWYCDDGVRARTGGFERAGGKKGRGDVMLRRRHGDRRPSEAVFSKRSKGVMERGWKRRGVSGP